MLLRTEEKLSGEKIIEPASSDALVTDWTLESRPGLMSQTELWNLDQN